MIENIIKILLIEDDEDDFILTSDLLTEVSGTNYQIEWESKFSKALNTLSLNNHDVCLVDYQLGEGNGIELLRSARAKGCSIPIILLTGQGDKEIDIEAAEAGASDYLIKGTIEATVLEKAIRYAIAHGRMLQTLRESEERFRSVVESAKDAIFLTDFHGNIISWNKSAEQIFGYKEDEISSRPLAELFPSTYHDESTDKDIKSLIENRLFQSNNKATELNGLKKDGTEFPLEISLSSWETINGRFYSGIIRDITDRKMLENQLTHQALHDPLTKLANRVLFRDRVEHALAKLDRNKTTIAILFLDLDNFKNINDSLGHAAGDKLLISVADRLRYCLRTSDTAARLGGDEFAILIEDTQNIEEAVFIAERVSEILRSPFPIEGKEIYVGTSIGIVVTVTGNEKPEELLRNADVAMYMAKTKGKGHHVVFENQMHDALMERIELEADLRAAIENQEFVVHFQPIVDLHTEEIMGMEALVRWNHPKHGLIAPNKFIPLAEETNLIIPLGKWVLEEACHQTKIWQEHKRQSSLSVSVNLSSRQFQEKHLVQMVYEALIKSGLSPQSLILEITETLMLQNTEAMIEKLEELKALGVRLAIDDFGTGYSSLSYLQRFPIDILKIDKTFIDKIDRGKEGSAVTRAIIMMGDSLNFRIIAEGIEHPQQISILRKLGCYLGQGFHFSQPLCKDEMSTFLLESRLKLNVPSLSKTVSVNNLTIQETNFQQSDQ